MLFITFKVILTAVMIVGISEISKRSSNLAAILASLPITSILIFIWIYLEDGKKETIAQMSWDIFYLVIPSLVFFVAFAILISRGVNFYLSLLISCLITTATYWIYIKGLKILKFM